MSEQGSGGHGPRKSIVPRPTAVVTVREEAVERFGMAEFDGTPVGNRFASLEAMVQALREDMITSKARNDLLKEQRSEALQSRAIWVPAVLSVIGIIVSIASLCVAIWAVLRTGH